MNMSELDIALLASLPMLLLTLAGWFAASRLGRRITMAQALLESNNGNSTLAVKGNNHFGIKGRCRHGNTYFRR